MVDAMVETGIPRSLARSRLTLTRSSGFDFLEAVLDIGHARNPAHRRHQLARQPVELIDLRAAHADLNRLLAERARLGQPERQARNLFDFLACRAQPLR
jgi:hypothetical protein